MSTSKLRLLILNGSSSTTTPNSTPIRSPFPPLLDYLTEAPPSDSLTSFAGYTSHPPLHLKTKYYDTRVTIWCDELPPPVTQAKITWLKPDVTKDNDDDDDDDDDTADADSSSPAADLTQWQSQMLSHLALEVRSVIGGIILVLPLTPQELLLQASVPLPTTTEDGGGGGLTEYIRSVHSLREAIEDESGTSRDVASLVVLQLASASPEPKMNDRLKEFAERLEAWCHEEGILGLDFVSWNGIVDRSGQKETEEVTSEKNEYGEKVGIERVREVLEAVDWAANPSTIEPAENHAGDDDDDDDDDNHLRGQEDTAGLDVFNNPKFHNLDSELQQEIMGLKSSMLDFKPSGSNEDGDEDLDGEDISPSQMHDLMDRMVAIREAGANMPTEERQAFAKREVEKIIRELM